MSRSEGWFLHAGVGCVAFAVVLVVPAPWNALLAVVGIGFAHELGDGDFQRAKGGPINGLLDWLAYLPGPLLYLVIGWLAR